MYPMYKMYNMYKESFCNMIVGLSKTIIWNKKQIFEIKNKYLMFQDTVLQKILKNMNNQMYFNETKVLINKNK